ncbi:MAG: cysteine--tRNA ligase [Neisseriales bacterium]|nr:MAG: cysteine--tRNA ligase [Neisseriales bacterium]
MLTLFNTLTKQKEVFVPIQGNVVRMYVCGVTVYDYCHIGHARMLVAFDVIYRWLMALGYDVTYVRNITDIDDKIIQRAMTQNESMTVLTERFTQAMHEDCNQLGLLQPNIEPHATEHIDNMITLIQELIAHGLAYVTTNGDVCYDIEKFLPYGQLSGKTPMMLQTESRIGEDETKRHVGDFVLWKKSKAGEPYWQSPWGLGRPGWHIECSAMSLRYLGGQFDIHGGGSDLQFPHHENEIAQSEGIAKRPQGQRWVNYWLHNGFVNINHQKMSKSLDNFITIRQVLKRVNGEVLRFLIVRSHYRSMIHYSSSILEDAKQSLAKLYMPLRYIRQMTIPEPVDWSKSYPARFKAAMNDDFNTAEAVAILFEMAHILNRTQDPIFASEFRALANILGLLTGSPEAFFQDTSTTASTYTKSDIETMISQRNAARIAKDWTKADMIRKALFEQGIVLEDDLSGRTKWRRM